MIKDLRDFIGECEKANTLKRVKTEVDWNFELSHISRLSEEAQGPCLLFENVKDYDIPVITGIFSTPKRLAIALGMDKSLSLCEMAQEWMKMSRAGHIPPEEVEKAPIKEKIIKEDEVDLLEQFPVPKFFPMDGGRYIGTAAFLVTEDPDEGWTNLGTYRMQVLDKNSVGVQFVKGKHAYLISAKYKKMGKKMPVAAVIGGAPVLFLVASTTVPYGVSEYDLAGALQKFPVEVVRSDLNNLLVPAGAEIVLEGEIDPDPETFRAEGPLGEYTGYYSGKRDEWPKEWFKVNRIMSRNKPIFTATTVGGPITDTHMLGAVQISASIWSDLMEMRIPGIKSVFCPPATTGRIWTIVSIKQMYPGHPVQVGCAVAGSTSGHYRLKGIIIVDDDIPADDWDKVFWALSVRYDPERSTQIIRRTRSGPLDPALPIDQRDIGSKIIMDACIPFEWERKPIKIELDQDVVDSVRKRWKKYGLSNP